MIETLRELWLVSVGYVSLRWAYDLADFRVWSLSSVFKCFPEQTFRASKIEDILGRVGIKSDLWDAVTILPPTPRGHVACIFHVLFVCGCKSPTMCEVWLELYLWLEVRLEPFRRLTEVGEAD